METAGFADGLQQTTSATGAPYPDIDTNRSLNIGDASAKNGCWKCS
jgi:hypothetical protein